MQEHYEFNDSQMSSLAEKKIGLGDLYKMLPLFCPYNEDAKPCTTISLLLYVDKKGDFNKKPFHSHKRVAQELFNNLPIKDQIAVAEYIEDSENNFQD